MKNKMLMMSLLVASAFVSAGVMTAGAKNTANSKDNDKGNKDHKVTICHKGHTITVDENAVPAHLRHGDHLGSCDVTPVKNR